MKISDPTNVTIAAIAPVSGLRTKPKLIAVPPIASHGMVNSLGLSSAAIPQASLNAMRERTQEISNAAMATIDARLPSRMNDVTAAARSGSNGINASFSVVIPP